MSAVHQWFNTTKNIKHEHLASIAAAFDSSLDWIITGQGHMDSDSVGRETTPVPATKSSDLSQIKAMIDAAKAEIIDIAGSIESRDVETAYRLAKLAIQVDEIKDVLS